ncbi:MAG: peptide chain release factor N(5)-glutamine methyltransferase [Pseudomonadota bacterium]
MKRFIAQQFESVGLPFADEDALDLVLGISGLSQTDYVLKGSDFPSPKQLERLHNATERRLAGEPVDRILGWREFYGRRFEIDGVLSPRGDTEVLLLQTLKAIEPLNAPRLLDLGTGSGALAISLLCERNDACVVATDVSQAALRTAKRNAEALGVFDSLTLIQSDWFENVPTARFNAIISNPPYITSDAMKSLAPEVADHDPENALHGGSDGLDPYRQIIPHARNYLTADGWLSVEIGFDQGDAVRNLFESSGYQDIRITRDPAGHDRVVSGQMGPNIGFIGDK